MHPVRIDSLDDPRLDDFARLTDVALRRVSEPEGGLYIAESNTVIERAVRAGHAPRSVLVQEKWLDSVLPLVADHDGPVCQNDAFEVFLKSADDKPGYFEFEVSPRNVVNLESMHDHAFQESSPIT